MESGYICKECGAPVEVAEDGTKTWACQHDGGTIVATLNAVVNADGGVSI